MYSLATVFPPLARVRRLPFSRDQFILLMVAVNEIFLGIDIYLAHSISGTIVPNEWIPIIFGPTAGVLLLVIGLLALRKRMLANMLASPIYVASIIVGLLGAYFHIRRGILPTGPPGEWVSIQMLVWAPPVLGPLTFALTGLLGISAAWLELPPDSGTLTLVRGIRLRLPFSKTRAYFFLVGLGTLASLLSMVFDHARTGFQNPWLWVSASIAIFGTVVPVVLGMQEKPTRADLATFTIAMLALILLGITGMLLHISENLIASGTIVIERFIRGAPFLAPMLFADMGTLGLLALLDPTEKDVAWSESR
jgi:preprotein translocase subunit Sss1